MASIKRQPNGRWQARFRCDGCEKHRGRPMEHSARRDRKIDAQQWLDANLAELVKGTFVSSEYTTAPFARWWEDWSARQVWTVGTREAAHTASSSVPFADVRMRDLRPSHFEAWVKAMTVPTRARPDGLAPSTIATRVNYVRMAMSAAVRDRVIARDPSEHVRLPRQRRAEAAMTIPTPDDVRRALEDSPDYFAPFIAVCAFAGLRLGEAAGLQLGDVDFLRRTLTVERQVQGSTEGAAQVVPPKYGSERTVFLPDELTAMLAQHVEQLGTHGADGWLLWNPYGDVRGLWNRNSAGAAWRTVRRHVGLEAYTLHDLRHFYASGLIAAGCDVVTVQRAMGHSSATITLGTYSHLWPTAEDKTRAAASDLMRTVAGLESVADNLRTRGASPTG